MAPADTRALLVCIVASSVSVETASTEKTRVVPEYDRHIERVLIMVPERDGDQGRGTADPRFVRAVYDELLTAIPSYSEVGIVAQARDRETVLGWSRLYDARDDIHLHFVRASEETVDLWSQDLGEYVFVNGEGRFLVSALPHPSMGTARAAAQSRANIARRIFGAAVISADFVFEGGNVMFDRTPEGLRVLVGEDVVGHTVESARRHGRRVTKNDVVERVARRFGAAEVVVLAGEQSGGLFHIDQAFALLREGKAVLQTPSETRSREAVLLSGYRAQLTALRYEIFEMPTSVEAIRRYQTSVNVLPFTDLQTGEDVVIFPVFPGEVAVNAPVVLSKEHLIGKAALAYAVFERTGYAPRPVRDVSHVSGGNTHCITNVLH